MTDDNGMTYDDGSNNNNYEDSSWAESEEGIYTYFVIFLSLLALVLILSKFLHDSPRLGAILPEAGMIIIVGIIAGYLIYLLTPLSDVDRESDDDSVFNGDVSEFVAAGLLSFSPKVFFFVLLPPIIFNSGYNLKREVFFRHITPISLFACVGTAISTFVVAIMLEILKGLDLTGDFKPHFTELLAFGALISATDPVSTLAVFQAKKVDPQLFYLVFGESLLNDAVGLLLFKTLSKFVGNEDSVEAVFISVLKFLRDFTIGFAGSMALGMFTGIATAFFFKKVEMRNTPLLELSLFYLIMYMPFFSAEMFDLSGIVTILFTGIAAKRYATQNLSRVTEVNVDALFRVTAHLAETCIFLELGLSVFGLSYYGSSEWKFACWAILACLIGRGLNIYPLRFVYNLSLLWAEKDNSDHQRSIIQSMHDPKNLQNNTSINVSNRRATNNASLEQLQGINPSLSTFSMTPVKKKDLKIRNNTAHMLWFSGLRGAVAYACAKTFPNINGNRPFFVFATIAIVLFTVFIFGCTTEFALNMLNIETNVDEDEYMHTNDTESKMIFLNTFENRYIYPHVSRAFNEDDRAELEILPGHDSRDGRFDKKSSSSTSPKAAFHHIHHTRSDIEPIENSNRRRQSLYDFGLGISASYLAPRE